MSAKTVEGGRLGFLEGRKITSLDVT